MQGTLVSLQLSRVTYRPWHETLNGSEETEAPCFVHDPKSVGKFLCRVRFRLHRKAKASAGAPRICVGIAMDQNTLVQSAHNF